MWLTGQLRIQIVRYAKVCFYVLWGSKPLVIPPVMDWFFDDLILTSELPWLLFDIYLLHFILQ